MLLSEWRDFPSVPCRKKNLMTARVSMLLKSRASLTWFRACFLAGRDKDLTAPRYCCVIEWNKLLYYCNTQRDGFCQNVLTFLCLSALQICKRVQSKTPQYILMFRGKILLHGLGSLQALMLRMTEILDF